MGSFSLLHLLVFAIVMLIFLLPIYFAPSIVALARHHRQRVAIVLLNLFLGWTFLGWVGTFVWSLVGDVDADQRR